MITFGAIRDIERAERENPKLQKISENLFDQVSEYIERKEKLENSSSLDTLETQNAKNTIKRLIEMREKKITALALVSARTGILAENLTESEQLLFDTIVELLKRHRDVLITQLEKKKPRTVVYHVKKTLPKFVGTDMNIYNLHENDAITMPKEMADLLIKEGVLEED